MMIASGLFGLDPSAILNYGISGLGFLLAFLSFRLLSKEQSKRTPNSTIIRAIYVFQVFSVILILAGSFVEWYRAAHSVDTQLETTKAQLAGLKIDYENALKSALTDRSDLEEKFVKSRRESKDLETKLRTELNTAN